jgi:hypothetical protein
MGTMSPCAHYLAKIIPNFEPAISMCCQILVEVFHRIGEFKYMRMGTINEMPTWENQNINSEANQSWRTRQEGEYLSSQLPLGGASSGADTDQ